MNVAPTDHADHAGSPPPRSRLDPLMRRLAGGDDLLRLPGPRGAVAVPLTPALTVVAVAAGMVGAGLAWWLPNGVAGVVAVLTIVAALAAGALTTVALVATGLRFWGLVHLGYLLVVVSLPLVGTAVGARVVDGTLGPAWSAVALVLLLPAPLGWYGTHVEPYRLRLDVRAVPIAATRPGGRRVRLGVLADLQTGRAGPHEHQAVDRLLAAGPDVILVPGDLFQGSAAQLDREQEGLRALLGRLRAPHGVYFARGDTDGGDLADRLLHGTGVVILDDEAVDVVVGDRRLRIGGNRLAYWEDPAIRLRRQLDGEDGEPDDGTVRILVAHRPDAVLDLRPGSRVDLTVAGHTHGGQIVVPGLGPLLTLSKVPRRVGGGGLHQVRGNWIYVSKGVGLERRQAPQVRLFCRPTIALLDLVPDPAPEAETDPDRNLGRNSP